MSECFTTTVTLYQVERIGKVVSIRLGNGDFLVMYPRIGRGEHCRIQRHSPGETLRQSGPSHGFDLHGEVRVLLYDEPFAGLVIGTCPRDLKRIRLLAWNAGKHHCSDYAGTHVEQLRRMIPAGRYNLGVGIKSPPTHIFDPRSGEWIDIKGAANLDYVPDLIQPTVLTMATV